MIYIEHLDEDLDIEYDIVYESAGRKGNYTGLPEDCFPDEFPEIEFEIISINGEDQDESNYNFEEIQEKYYDELETQIWEEKEREEW